MIDWDVVAEDVRAGVLAPAAAAVDRSGAIPAGHFDALRGAGLYGTAFSSSDPLRTLAEVGEILVSGCLSTAFVWAQHHGTLLRLATSGNDRLKSKYLAAMQSGNVRAGVSGSGYAKPENALVTARRASGGYSITGTAPFVTGWNGLSEVIGITAYDGAEQKLVTFLVDAVDGRGLSSERLDLTAAHASHTVKLVFDGLNVPDDAVMNVSDRPKGESGALSGMDRAIVRLNGSLALGTARACLRELTAMDRRSEDLEARHADVKRTLTQAIGDTDVDIYRARADSSQFAVDVANYLASVVGSKAIVRGATAERLLREAAFGLVCTTTAEIKEHLLRGTTSKYAEASV